MLECHIPHRKLTYMNICCNTLIISDLLSSDLAFRNTAKSLFRHIESLPEQTIIIDFRDVRSMTRSFAQEYATLKKETQKNIIEINMASNIGKMFSVVSSFARKTRLLDSNKGKPIVLNM